MYELLPQYHLCGQKTAHYDNAIIAKRFVILKKSVSMSKANFCHFVDVFATSSRVSVNSIWTERGQRNSP